MKMSKSFKVLSVLLIAAILVIAGCGNNKGKNDNAAGGNAAGGAAADSAAIAKIKERGKLLVGVKFDTRLFGLKDPASGNVEGFDIDISKAIAKKFSVTRMPLS